MKRLFLTFSCLFFGFFDSSFTALAQSPPDWSNPTETVDWIMGLPGESLRRSALSAWIDEVPAEGCQDSIEAIWKADNRQRNYMTRRLLARWASHDPMGAWRNCQWMVRAASDTHFSDRWDQWMIGPEDPAIPANFHHWPRQNEIEKLYFGIRRSGRGGSKLNEVIEEFEGLYFKRFGEKIPNPDFEESLSPDPVPLSEINLLLTCDLEEIPILLKSPSTRENYAATQFGLRRLASEDPKTALAIARRFDLESWHIFRVWAQGNGESLFPALDELPPEEKVMALGAMLSVEPSPFTTRVTDMVKSSIGKEDTEEDGSGALAYLAGCNPEKAFDLFFHCFSKIDLDNFATYDDMIYAAFDSPESPAVQRTMRALLSSFQVPTRDDHAYILMEEWGDIDVGEAARFGVSWMLRSESNTQFHPGLWRSWSKEHLIDVWSGKKDPDDSSMDDRTYGALRCWALCEPEKMRAWMETLEDPAVREALTWLRENASGKPGAARRF